jgi:hypothetical protein
MRLSDVIKFQKALTLAASASNPFETEAAELAVRRLVKACSLDPTRIPDQSFISDVSFADNNLLRILRDEWRDAHPVPAKEPSKTRNTSLDDVPNIR